MIKAEIIADSINRTTQDRITTFILEYPRMVHAELMTHRMFSKNAASSRAIPIEKMIQQVIDNPAMPVWWGKNQSGMQAKEELDNTIKVGYTRPIPDDVFGMGHVDCEGTDRERAKEIWLDARDSAIKFVKSLNRIGLHKQICNRILEPWFNIRIILTGTEFENFFALRAHKDAQPEIQALAYKMLEEYNKSTPKELFSGQWHIPFGDKIDECKLADLVVKPTMISALDKERYEEQIQDLKIKIAIARCARISYYNYEGKDDYRADVALCDRLFGNIPKHLSPTEHVAQAQNCSNFFANFKGWKQYRHFFADENLKDPRIIKKFNTEEINLQQCEQCNQPAWDGYICHSCGLKNI